MFKCEKLHTGEFPSNIFCFCSSKTRAICGPERRFDEAGCFLHLFRCHSYEGGNQLTPLHLLHKMQRCYFNLLNLVPVHNK